MISLPLNRATPQVDKTSICYGRALKYHCVEDHSEIFLPFGRFYLEINTWAWDLKSYNCIFAQWGTELLRAWSLLGDRWPRSGWWDMSRSCVRGNAKWFLFDSFLWCVEMGRAAHFSSHCPHKHTPARVPLEAISLIVLRLLIPAARQGTSDQAPPQHC